MSSSRNYCMTINNWTENDEQSLLQDNHSYLVYGKEIGENGTPHLQIYIEYNNSKRFNTMKKRYPRAHIETRKGTSIEASNYCKKDGNFIEKGEISQQGKRSDLNKLKEMIISNEASVDDLCITDPYAYHEFGRTLNKIEDIQLRKKFRNWMTTCEWCYGETGTGKSHYAFTNFNPDTHYVFPNDNGWWDGYKGQETVIINEFRGQIQYSELLDLIDKYPKTVKRRNREPCPFLAKHIIITSSMTPNEVYHNLAENDKLEQIYRRITLKHFNECFSS